MFKIVEKFEKNISEFFGANYAVATDCCTHALELCLRYQEIKEASCPEHTYISVPFTFKKLNLDWKFEDNKWRDFYFLKGTNIVDAAVLWEEGSFISGTFMCLSFQYKKHLSLGRGGAILLDKKSDYDALKKMSYDGRTYDKPWKEQNIDSIGYHYYMTPETAQLGLEKFPEATIMKTKRWSYADYPYLPKMEIFNEHN